VEDRGKDHVHTFHGPYVHGAPGIFIALLWAAVSRFSQIYFAALISLATLMIISLLHFIFSRTFRSVTYFAVLYYVLYSIVLPSRMLGQPQPHLLLCSECGFVETDSASADIKDMLSLYNLPISRSHQ
jgi:hypothetical protein